MLLGFDLETTGSDPLNDLPIQIGFAVRRNDTIRMFRMDIGGWAWKTMPWSTEAFGVHGITKERLMNALHYRMVDTLASEWLGQNLGGLSRNKVHATGWNVAGFDLPFLRRFLPKSLACISYRTVDLNAPLLLAADSNARFRKIKSGLKKRAQATAEEWIEARRDLVEEADMTWHDAGFDAITALLVAEEMQERLSM